MSKAFLRGGGIINANGPILTLLYEGRGKPTQGSFHRQEQLRATTSGVLAARLFL